MPPQLPTERQQQHRAYMSQAMATAPKNLSPRDKMKWAAAGWQRQSQTRVGGTTHPGFKAVAESIAAREGLPLKNANAILSASTRRASVKAKTLNPHLKRVKGGLIRNQEGRGVFSTLAKAAPHIIKGVQLASKIAARVIGDKNQTASDVLDILGGLGIQKQKQARAKKLTEMRRKQRIR